MMGLGWAGSNPWMVMSAPAKRKRIWGGGHSPSLFLLCPGQCCRLILGRVEDEQWVGVPTRAEPSSVTQGPALWLQPPYHTQPPVPSTVFSWEAGGPVAAQAPVLVENPPPYTPTCLSALYSSLSQVGAGERAFNTFTIPRIHQPCAPKPDHSLGPGHIHSPHNLLHASPACSSPPEPSLVLPTSVAPHHAGSAQGSGALSPTWVPWQPGCHGTMGAGLAEQQLWVTRVGKTGAQLLPLFGLQTPFPSSPAEQKRP